MPAVLQLPPNSMASSATKYSQRQQQACPCGGQPNLDAVRHRKAATEVDLLSLKHEFIYPGCGNGYLEQLETEAKDGFKVRSNFLSDQLGNIIAENQLPKKQSQKDDYILLDTNIPISHTFRNGGIVVTNKHKMSPSAWHKTCQEQARRMNFGDEFVESAETPYTDPTVKWSGVVLTFAAYFTEQDPLRDIKSEPRRLAHMCTLQYFMEDETAQLNQLWGPSKQGRQRLTGRRRMLITMHRCDDTPSLSNSPATRGSCSSSNTVVERVLNWRDLQVGVELQLYAFHIKLIDADDFTRTLLHSLGIEVSPPMSVPDHLYDRPKDWSHLPNPTKYINVDGSWRTGDSEREKFQKYMCNTNQILAFTVIYNDLHALYGDLHLFQLRFHLEDDTIEVVVHPDKAHKLPGYEPWQIYLHRGRCQSQTDCDPKTASPRFIEPKDFQIGQYVRIHDRTFLVCDCDPATARWYADNMHCPDYAAIVIDWKRMLDEYDTSGLQPRLYTVCSGGIGNVNKTKSVSAFDKTRGTVNGDKRSSSAMQNNNNNDGVMHRENQLLNSAGAQAALFLKSEYTLRFVAELVVLDAAPYNAGRKFIIRFWTVDGTMAIYEVRQHNTGHIGGQLLARSRVFKSTLGDCLPRIELMYRIGDSPYGRDEDERNKIRPDSIDFDTLASRRKVAGGDAGGAVETQEFDRRSFIGLPDLYIGAMLNIRGTVYRIIDCDDEVLRFAYKHPTIWSGDQMEQLQVACRRHGYDRNEYGFSDKEFEKETDNNEHWSNVLEQGLRRVAAEKKKHLFTIFLQKFGTDSTTHELTPDHIIHIADVYQLPSSRPVALELLQRFHDWADKYTIAGGCVNAEEECVKDGSACPKVERRKHDIVTFARYLLHDGLGPYYRRLMQEAKCIEPETGLLVAKSSR